MGCLFSSADEPERASSKPLLSPATPSSATPAALLRQGSAANPFTAAEIKKPSFKRPVTHTAKAAPTAGVGIFCACGGPGSLVQLLPCNHHALCLSCAQSRADGCSVCGTAVTDSVPSFRTRSEL